MPNISEYLILFHGIRKVLHFDEWHWLNLIDDDILLILLFFIDNTYRLLLMTLCDDIVVQLDGDDDIQYSILFC